MGLLSGNKKKQEWNPEIPLTVDGGPFDRGETLRSISAYYIDGRLIVSKYHLTNPQILSLVAEIKLTDFPDAIIEPVDISQVQACYDNTGLFGETASGQDDARMRRDVLELVAKVSKRRASDIHILVQEQNTIVRARIDGSMQHIVEWPADYGHNFCAAAFTMADAADVNYQPYEYQGARVSSRKDLQLPEGVISLRLQFNPTTFNGRALIIRLLYTSDDEKAGDIAGLGFTPDQLEDFTYMRAKPFGINIVAGPTGHGKSTTLQRNIVSILQEHHYNIAIYTVEDPPEYPIPGAVQMPVVNAASAEARAAAFSKAIAAALRSNPDRIMIGEVRDPASAQLAFEAAMTGHQVWTTLHSNDAITIPFRLRDLDVEHYKLADPTLLTGLVSQRLVKKLCPNCMRMPEPDDIPYDLQARMEAFNIAFESLRIHNEHGCEVCGPGNGYGGRTVCAEVIVPDAGFMELVKEDKKWDAERYWLTHLNGRNMMENIAEMVGRGEVDPRDSERIMGPLSVPERG